VSRFTLAFQAEGYRSLWLNALCTSATYSIEVLSQGWLVLVLTNSPLWVGLAAGVRGASQTLFSLPGGYLVDRMDRRRLLMGTQMVAALGASVLGILVLLHAVRLWEVFVYLAVTGSITAISRPSLSGLVYDTVGEERLLNASAFQFIFMATGIVKIIGALAGASSSTDWGWVRTIWSWRRRILREPASWSGSPAPRGPCGWPSHLSKAP